MSKHVFVLGPDERNLEMLRESPALEDCVLHRLLDSDDLVHVDRIDFNGLLAAADQHLREFDDPVDAVIGYWDFPVCTMVPLLCEPRGLYSADLRALLKCEHKYWSRLEQRKVIKDLPDFEVVDLEHHTRPPAGVSYPMWLKPVKSFSSQLAFKVHDDAQFDAALDEIREGIGRVGKPFDAALSHASLPDEIAEIGAMACIAEETVTGQQLTVEGYSAAGRIHFYGIVDSVLYPGTSSFQRYEYPSSLPQDVRDRVMDASERVIRQIGLDWVPFNIEFFWDSETRRLNLLEVNPRHSQSHAQMFEAVDGAPNHQAMVQLALGRDPRMPLREGEHKVAGKWFYRRFSDAVVRHAPTEEEIAAVERDNPGVRITVLPQDGMYLNELPDQDSYSFELAHLYIGARDAEDMQAKYDRCVAALPFEFDEVGGRT